MVTALILESVKVHGDAERGTNLILAAVTATNSARLVVVPFHRTRSSFASLVAGSDSSAFFDSGRTAASNRRQARVKLQHDALIHATLSVRRLILNVCVDKERHHGAGQARRTAQSRTARNAHR